MSLAVTIGTQLTIMTLQRSIELIARDSLGEGVTDREVAALMIKLVRRGRADLTARMKTTGAEREMEAQLLEELAARARGAS